MREIEERTREREGRERELIERERGAEGAIKERETESIEREEKGDKMGLSHKKVDDPLERPIKENQK